MATAEFELDSSGQPVRRILQDHKTSTKNSSFQTEQKEMSIPGPRSLVEITRPEEPDNTDAIPVFSIDGAVYSMPGRVPMTLALQTLENVAEHGMEVAMISAVKQCLGAEAWVALKTCDYLTIEQLSGIMDMVTDHITGAMEAVKAGN